MACLARVVVPALPYRATQRRPLGDTVFIEPLEAILTRHFRPAKRGRRPTEIQKLFGADVAGLFNDLTEYLDRNKATGRSAEPSTVRIAPEFGTRPDDQNRGPDRQRPSIATHNPKFAATYMAEMRALLEVLVKADPALREQAYLALESFLQEG